VHHIVNPYPGARRQNKTKTAGSATNYNSFCAKEADIILIIIITIITEHP